MTSDWWTGSTDNRQVTELNCEESSDRVCARVVHQSDAQEQWKSVLLAKNIGGQAYHTKRCQNNCMTVVPNTKMCHTIHQPNILEQQVSALQWEIIGQLTNHAEKCHRPQSKTKGGTMCSLNMIGLKLPDEMYCKRWIETRHCQGVCHKWENQVGGVKAMLMSLLINKY